MKKGKCHFVGLMSGSSLDGLDIALCSFFEEDGKLFWECVYGTTIPFPLQLLQKIEEAPFASSVNLFQTHVELGKWIGQEVKKVINEQGFIPNYIASHGHTVLHQPDKGFTLQIGSAEHITVITKTPVIFDFRSLDIALGGQGAPLVPKGDMDLFPGYNACLNLGGIANITLLNQSKVLAWDVCPFNQPLNFIAQKLGKPYDENGKWASEGEINQELLQQLNQLNFFQKPHPKSLSNEWVRDIFIPLAYDVPLKDALRTFIAFFAEQLAQIARAHHLKKVLISGGGVYNTFFVKELQKSTPETRWVIPKKTIIDYKEAIIFAYLGYLRVQEKVNVLSSVTGASVDSISGKVIAP